MGVAARCVCELCLAWGIVPRGQTCNERQREERRELTVTSSSAELRIATSFVQTAAAVLLLSFDVFVVTAVCQLLAVVRVITWL